MSEVKLLGREDILKASDVKMETVQVPEWGGAVLVKALSGVERDDYEESIMIRGKKGAYEVNTRLMRAKLVAASIVDAKGKAIFSEDDLEVLSKKSAAALDRVFKVAQRLSGLTEEQVQESAARLEGAQESASVSA